LINDNADVFFDNIEMFKNIYNNCIKYNLLLITFTSGAEDFENYLGIAKKAISSICNKVSKNIINLKIYNCFGNHGLKTRFIEGNIINYIYNKNIIIHKNRFFDFFYSEDVYKIICYFINNYKKGNINTQSINCVYKEKTLLSDVAEIINSVDNKSVNIVTINYGLDIEYCTEDY